MKTKTKSLLLASALTGALVGTAVAGAPEAPKKDDTKTEAPKKDADKAKDKAACGGPGGCGAKGKEAPKKDADKAKDKAACGGPGGCGAKK